jgi:hypothetical protein
MAWDAPGTALRVQFENGQVRIVRVLCAAKVRCPESEHPKDPAVTVARSMPEGPLEQVRIELKARPVN